MDVLSLLELIQAWGLVLSCHLSQPCYSLQNVKKNITKRRDTVPSQRYSEQLKVDSIPV